MLVEDGTPTERAEILRCDPKVRQLQVRRGEGVTLWQLELAVSAFETGSTVNFRSPVSDPQIACSVGPGWEWNLDRFVVAVSGTDAERWHSSPISIRHRAIITKGSSVPELPREDEASPIAAGRARVVLCVGDGMGPFDLSRVCALRPCETSNY